MLLMPVVAAWVVSSAGNGDEPLGWLGLLAGYAVGIVGVVVSGWFAVRRGDMPVPQELPAVPPLFLGRSSKVDEAVAYLRASATTDQRLVVVSGPPGIGKTAFALHVAHRIAAEFPDGQLYATLDGRGGNPEKVVHNTLKRFLKALGHPTDRMPSGLDACRLAFQRLSASKKLLVVLDDVYGIDPRAVIPPGPASATVITSQHAPAELGPHLSRPLDSLSDSDAVELLANIVGEQRVEESQGAAVALAQACAGIPQALQMTGQALVARPSADMSMVVSRTDAGVARPDPRGWALEVSYRLLTEGDQAAVLSLGRLSRRFEPRELARETDLDEEQARSLADRLSANQFVDRYTTDAAGVPVYQTVEQVQDFARLRAGVDTTAGSQPQPDRDPLDEQQIHTYGLLDKGDLVAADVNVRDLLVSARVSADPLRTGRALALLAELRAELGGTDEVVDLADDAWQYDDPGIRARVLRVMGHIQRRVRQLDVAEANLSEALNEAAKAEDQPERIRILVELALVDRLGGRPERALEHTGEARMLAGQRSDGGIRYQPRILLAEAMTSTVLKQWEQAERQFVEARSAADRTGFMLWRHWIDYREAQLRLRAGQPEQARELVMNALAGFTGIRHRYGTGHCRLLLGRIHVGAEELESARTVIEDALETFRNCGDRFIEGHAAADLASVHLAVGSLPEAADALRRAKQLKTGQRYWRTSLRLVTAQMRQAAGIGRDQAASSATRHTVGL
ncbi:NB-ARC domain-containing protein [Actinoplanes solisilvae]|uniref:NB-ARC domain-containing protein n=1 Tax=Actinoplanes solisilvae TaxID=2486853 RepID=UPI0032C44721